MTRAELWCKQNSGAISRWYWRVAWVCLVLCMLVSTVFSLGAFAFSLGAMAVSLSDRPSTLKE